MRVGHGLEGDRGRADRRGRQDGVGADIRADVDEKIIGTEEMEQKAHVLEFMQA